MPYPGLVAPVVTAIRRLLLLCRGACLLPVYRSPYVRERRRDLLLRREPVPPVPLRLRVLRRLRRRDGLHSPSSSSESTEAALFLPMEPISSFSIGAICCTFENSFWTLVIVPRMPSRPPMRSINPFSSPRFASEKPPLPPVGAASAEGITAGRLGDSLSGTGVPPKGKPAPGAPPPKDELSLKPGYCPPSAVGW